MECKDTRIEDSALTEYRIDLTRMECKGLGIALLEAQATGIDLTRMECKAFYRER